MENENVKKVTDAVSDTYQKAKNGVEDYLNKPEVKENIEKAKDATINVAEKAVAALKAWLKPEEENKEDKTEE